MPPSTAGKHVETLALEILGRLRALQDHSAKPLRALRREYSRRVAKWEPREVVALAIRLLEWPSNSTRFLSYEILNKHKPAAASLGRADLERLGRGIDNWGAVDLFGCFVAGPAWRERQVPDALIHRWARSPDRWWRRAALVCTVPLNMPAQGGKGDPERTLAVCAKLIDDRDDMVVKALSWSLRALARQAPAAVTAFLTDHHPRLAARVTREVRHKLSTGLKNPRPNKPRRGLKPS